MGSNDELITIIKELVKTFHLERILYSIATTLAFLLLLFCAIYLLCIDIKQIQAIVGMCGSTGVIAFTCGKFLKMWDDAIKLVQQHFNK